MVYTLTHMRVVLALNYTRFCRIDSIISNKCPINALGGGEAVGTTAISSVRPIWTLVLAVFFSHSSPSPTPAMISQNDQLG